MIQSLLSLILLYFQLTYHSPHAISSDSETNPHDINTVNKLGHILHADSPDPANSDPSDAQLQQDVADLHEPDFLLIGVVKSGSTSLYHYLVQHPQISGVESTYLLPDSMRTQITGIIKQRRAGKLPPPKRPKGPGSGKDPMVITPGNYVKKTIYDINNFDLARMIKPIIDQKEVRFFDSFWYNHLQTVTNHSLLTAWKWYLQVFNQDELAPGAHLLRGEASPTYFASSQFTAERIKLWLPNVKLILLLRNPVRRFVSHLKMIKENHASNLRFRKQRQTELTKSRKSNGSSAQDGTRSLLQYGTGMDARAGAYNPFNNPFDASLMDNARYGPVDAPFAANTRYGRNKMQQMKRMNKRPLHPMAPFVRTRSRMHKVAQDYNRMRQNKRDELTEEVMGHEDDEYINEEANLYEEQRQTLLRQRGGKQAVRRPNRDQHMAKNNQDKRRKPVNKMEKIIGAIYKLSMYQVILVSNANPDSCDFYQKRWGITRDVTGFINRLLFGGTYTMRMKEWLKRFDKDHLFYRESSELFNDPVGLMKELETFLGITPFGDEMWSNITAKVYNVELEKGKGYQHKVQDTEEIEHWDIDVEKETQIVKPDESEHWLSQEIISKLKDYYRPHNRQLADLFDGNKYKDW
eukprot:217524_1